MIQNKADLTKCAACETPRPGAKSANGSSSSNDASKPAAAPAVTFGAPASSSAPAFNWGAPAAATASTSSGSASAAPSVTGGGWSFGSSVPASSGFNFSFGKPSSDAATLTSSSAAAAAPAAFTFGQQSTSASFSFATAESAKSDSADADADGDQQQQQLQFADQPDLSQGSSELNPLFKDRHAEASGEEQDTVHARIQCKVFTLEQQQPQALDNDATSSASASASSSAAPAKRWAESGTGELHVNSFTSSESKSTAPQSARLILRTDKTQRLVLNAPLLSASQQKVEMQGDKFVRFASFNLQGEAATFLLRFKGRQEADEAFKAIQKVQQLLQ